MRFSASRTFGDLFDSFAIGISFVCLIHCLALPIILALLPAVSAWLDVPESFHAWIFTIALPFSLIVLLGAIREGRGRAPLLLGAAGLGGLALGLLVRGPFAEALVTSAGGLLLASAHVLNWRRRSSCHV